MKQEDLDLAYKKAKGQISLCLADLVLLNVHEEKTTTSLWKKIGVIYHGKSLVNKLFLRKKLYSLKMREGTYVADHLNAFNMIIVQLTYVGDNNEDEDRCLLLLCSFPYTWDHLVMAFRSTITTFKMEDVVSSVLSKEARRKEALIV